MDDKTKRYFNGIVARAPMTGLCRGAYRYRIELRPWIWLLSRIQDCRIFQNKSALDIITNVFRDAGFSDFEDKRQNRPGDTMLEYCVQYRETSFDFVTRLMEKFGLYYFFTHSDRKHTLVFADDPELARRAGHGDSVPDRPDGIAGHRRSYLGVVLELHLQSGGVHASRLQFHHALGRPDGKDDRGRRPYATALRDVRLSRATTTRRRDGQKLADVRMQDIAAGGRCSNGTSNCRGLHAGGKFKLSGFTDAGAEPRIPGHPGDLFGGSSPRVSRMTAGELIDTFRCVFAGDPGRHAVPA